MRTGRHWRGAFFYQTGHGLVFLALFAALQLPCAPPTAAAEVSEAAEVPEATAAAAADSMPVPTLPPLLVVEKLDDPLTGSTSLNRETIRSIPQANPNITDLAPLLPGVQASDDANRSHYGGEILPARISISGGKADQNNFVIDGVSGGNLIDPLASNPEDINSIPGNPQGIFPNTRLIEELTVLDHNIPARYGNFTGGVVEVKTRKPAQTFGAGVNYRTTRSNWTWFHLSQDNRDALESTSSIKDYPQFDFVKYDAGFEVDIPTGDNSGLLGAYQRSRSDLSYPYLGGEKDQYRLLENYLVKWSHDLGEGESFDLSLVATPYEANHFLKDARNSDYQIRNRTFALNAGWTTLLSNTVLEVNTSFAKTELARRAPQEMWYWKDDPDGSKNWGTDGASKEGGFGSLESGQESFLIESHLKTPFNSGRFHQEVGSGVEVGWSNGYSRRSETAYRYANATLVSPPVDCGGDPYCSDGEQYFKAITVYDAYRVETDRAEFAVYLEDQLAIGPLALRPGLRFSYETFSANQNLAPRFSSAYDLYGTQLFFGANRYYGELAFTNVLREKIPTVRAITRTSFTAPWVSQPLPKTATRRSELKTPYSDELSAGVKQPLPGGYVSFDYVHRKGQDEIARQKKTEVQADGTNYSITRFNNNGRSHYESYRLGWEKAWRVTTLLMNVAYEEANTSVEGYDDYLDDDTLNQWVYFNGQTISRDELPRTDYSRNWLGNLILTQKLPLGCEFSNVTRYRGAYGALELVKADQDIDGQIVDVYAEVKTPAGWTFDWKLAWRQPSKTAEILLSLEVLNVFNHSNRVGGEDGLYEQGRQIWVGVEGRF
ncbi:MAG TPA: hypothetical protein DCF93_00325 [Desulfuromonas sp.]|nr:hypothetical protein [Desulfuromonas sp.]